MLLLLFRKPLRGCILIRGEMSPEAGGPGDRSSGSSFFLCERKIISSLTTSAGALLTAQKR